MTRLLISVSLCVVLTACASTPMYTGDTQPKEKVATIVGAVPYNVMTLGVHAQVKKVDNKAVPNRGTRVAVLPGKHSLQLYCKKSGFEANHKHNVRLLAGEKYLIKVEVEKNTCITKLVNKSTGKPL